MSSEGEGTGEVRAPGLRRDEIEILGGTMVEDREVTSVEVGRGVYRTTYRRWEGGSRGPCDYVLVGLMKANAAGELVGVRGAKAMALHVEELRAVSRALLATADALEAEGRAT